MNYFLELLESYSRLKKRNLKLLEEDQPSDEGPSPEALKKAKNAVNTFEQLLANASGISASYPEKDVYQKQSETYRVRIFKEKNKPTKRYQYKKSYYAVADLPQEGTPEWLTFVSYFETDLSKRFGSQIKSGEVSPNVVTGKTGTSRAKGPTLIGWFQGIGQKIRTALGTPGNRPTFFNKILREFTNKDDREAFETSTDRKFDGTIQMGSLARSLDNSITIDIVNGKPKAGEKSDAISQNLKQELGEIISDAIEKFSKGEPFTEDECEKFKQNFQLVKGGGMIVRNNETESNRGLFLIDSSNYMRKLFRAGASQVGCNIVENVDLGDSILGGSNLRGKYGERVDVLLSLISACKDPERKQELENCDDVVEELVEEIRNYPDEFKEDLFNIIKRKNLSEEEGGDYSIPLDNVDAMHMEALTRIFGSDREGVQEAFKRLIAGHMYGQRIRRPDFVIHVAEEVGGGVRDDTVELYKTKDSAVQALMRHGLSREEAEKFTEPVNVSSICNTEARRKTCPKDRGVPYFKISNSLKTYISFKKGAKLGSLSENTRTMAILGDCPETKAKGCSPEEIKKAKDFYDSVAKRMGFTDKDLESNKEIEKQIKAQDKLVDDLPVKAATTGRTKGLITKDSLKDICKVAEDQLRSVLSHDEFKKSDAAKILKKMKEGDLEDPERVKGVIKNLLKQELLKRKASSDNPDDRRAAKVYAATEANLTGACKNPTLFSGNEMETGRVFVCDQNAFFDPCREALSPETENDYEIVFEGRTTHIQHKKDRTKKVSYGVAVGDTGIQTSVVDVGPEALESKRLRQPKLKPGMELASRNIKLSNATLKLAHMLLEFSKSLKN